MRLSRVYTDQALAPEITVQLDESAANYLGRSLKLKRGDNVVLFNGDGSDYAADITELTRKGVVLEVRSRLPGAGESPLKLTLVQAIGRGDRMDYSLQKATELGVYAIQPLQSARVAVKLDGKRLERRIEHWRGVVLSACEQSGRAVVPRLFGPLSPQQWVSRETAATRLVLDPLAELALSAFELCGPEAELAVGPEGGFDDQEMALMRAAGVMPVALGPRILRTETAGPAAITVLQSRFGDF
ncbi:MAG: 16S rRNA (uracil(1498)-N(3))-methyltransferase [Xanthomonadales bacterium]|nr:16S rRNA (uracil(1498)-N(3))-methyltransferase [Gammaproteobacteria bacterium]NNE04259.1 16S rRNA (uracil(1498)-N(3))-methyltransferase [Xanthomonadales bacterium]NNL95948.1 16S rRNA (uracil(1498)-N(3))-methyltransferase [Xanthomonadales bacterium]